MPSAVRRIMDYYEVNQQLCAAIPFDRVYDDIIPPGAIFPYATVSQISETVRDDNRLTDGTCVVNNLIQFSIFSRSRLELEAKAEIYKQELDLAELGAGTTICKWAGGGQVPEQDQPNAQPIYHRYLEFQFDLTRAAPPTGRIAF